MGVSLAVQCSILSACGAGGSGFLPACVCGSLLCGDEAADFDACEGGEEAQGRSFCDYIGQYRNPVCPEVRQFFCQYF